MKIMTSEVLKITKKESGKCLHSKLECAFPVVAVPKNSEMFVLRHEVIEGGGNKFSETLVSVLPTTRRRLPKTYFQSHCGLNHKLFACVVTKRVFYFCFYCLELKPLKKAIGILNPRICSLVIPSHP
jgi:hypothetical protein